MKTGILTTYHSRNYGACLQAFALQAKLRLMGYDTELIRYFNRERTGYICRAAREIVQRENLFAYINRRYHNLIIKVRTRLYTKAYGEMEQERSRCFEKFINENFVLGEKDYSTPKEFMSGYKDDGYDAYICGSDQVWNPATNGYDDVYFLNFPTEVKKCAYAPSIANNSLCGDEVKRIADSIKGIDMIGLREDTYIDSLREMTGKDIRTVIDPTFLLTKNEWLSLVKTDLVLPERYILVYLLDYNDIPKSTYKAIADAAESLDCEIVMLPYTYGKIPTKRKVHRMYGIAPNDMIHLIEGASYIMTNSFHASALSVNLNKNFIVFFEKSKAVNTQLRMSYMLGLFDLTERMVTDIKGFKRAFTEKIDYEKVNTIVEKHRRDGEEYLQAFMNL